MSISRAGAEWIGSLRDGQGTMKPAHASEVPFSIKTRFEGAPGTNPEEMIGAALAGCFSMALTGSLTRAGFSPESVKTSAEVHLEKLAQGFTITAIALTTVAAIPDIEPVRFAEIAEEAKKTCPVSRALAGVTITLDASLAPR